MTIRIITQGVIGMEVIAAVHLAKHNNSNGASNVFAAIAHLSIKLMAAWQLLKQGQNVERPSLKETVFATTATTT